MCVQCEVRVVGGMCLNIVVIVVCFVASVMLSLLIHVFYLYIAIVKRVALIVVNALYKSPIIIIIISGLKESSLDACRFSAEETLICAPAVPRQRR